MQRLRRHRNVSTVLVPYLYSSAFLPASEKHDEEKEKEVK
jgi:hypothetical protein